jgi:hypothetical protein
MPHKRTNPIKNKQTIRVMIPIGTPDLDTIFSNPRWADEARAFYHYLYRIKTIMRKNSNYAPGLDRESGFVPVLAEDLKNGLGMHNRYTIIRDKLLDLGVIEIKRRASGKPEYVAQMYSMKYRVKHSSAASKGGRKYRVETITDSKVVAYMRNFYSGNYKVKRQQFLSDSLWYKPNLELIEQMYLDDTAIDFALQQKERTDNLIGGIAMFNSKIGRFISKDDFAGRIHHHLGVLEKELRPFLRIENLNEPLCIVDVKSAQPYLLSALLSYPRLIELIPEFKPVLGKVTEFQSQPDTKLFFEHCASGTFYENWIQVTGMDKEKAKKLLFRHVFYSSASNQHRDNKVKQDRLRFRNLFGTMYKSVYKSLTNLKRTQSRTLPFVKEITSRHGDKGRMYVTPNMMAQRLETSILLHLITKRCNNSGVITATIHDAWILKEKDVVKFYKIFNQVFEDLGIRPPKLSYERLNACDNNIEV